MTILHPAGRHDVRGKTREGKTLYVGFVGVVALTQQTFEVRAAPGQQLTVYGRAGQPQRRRTRPARRSGGHRDLT